MLVKNVDIGEISDYPIFASREYLKTLSNNYGWIGGYENDSLLFALPYVIKKKFIFRYLVFQTDVIYCQENIFKEREKEFLNEVVDFSCKMRIDFIGQPPTNVVFNQYPDKSIFAPFGTYQVKLSSEQEIWQGIHSKHKNVIRKAIKDGVEVVRGVNYIDDVYRILSNTMARSSMRFTDKELFYSHIRNMYAIDNIEIFVCIKDSVIQGCAVIPYNKYCAYYLWGGSIEQPYGGAMNLLHYEMMKYFLNKGVKAYDFVGARIHPEEGSKFEGIQRFKSRFGGDLKEGYLWKIPVNKVKCLLFHLIYRIMINKKGDIVDQEKNRA